MFHAPIATGDGDTPSPIRLRVLSLGAGVQSTIMVLLVAHGWFSARPLLDSKPRKRTLFDPGL